MIMQSIYVGERKMSNWQMKHKEDSLPVWSKILPNRMKEKMQKKRKPKIAVLNLHGTIMRNQGGSFGNRQLLNYDNTKDVIDKAFNTKKLEAIFLNINSPGGSPVQTELIADYIQLKTNEKKVLSIFFGHISEQLTKWQILFRLYLGTCDLICGGCGSLWRLLAW